MPNIEVYRTFFLDYLASFTNNRNPVNLYEPMNYILSIGGKRIRPILTLIGADIFGNNYKEAIHAALAVEVFHNFSLVHDDIMDNASLRRGKLTVHKKWNTNTAILSGDAMLILAYQLFENYTPEIFQELAKLFSKTAIEVCEGQQYDIDFENTDNVTEAQYLKMICYKTAVLVGAALKMGAIVAKTNQKNNQLIYDFGVQIGMAFQLQDDYLDTFGDETFGKKIGGDILENKKTMLFIKAYERANEEDKKQLILWYKNNHRNPEDKIKAVTELFRKTNADAFVRNQIQAYTSCALKKLDELKISTEKRNELREFAYDLMDRKV